MATRSITVAGLLKSRAEAIGLPFELLGGASGLERAIASPHIQKTGLALAGFDAYLQPARILVFGESEIRYLESLDAPSRMNVLAAAFSHDIPCVLITGGWDPPVELLAASDRYDVPLLRTAVSTPVSIAKIEYLLDDELAERQVIHGVLMDMLGLGVLIIGESGIGKSECGLDLVVRGHRLVADDTVEIRRRGETTLIGTCPDMTRYHMEIRGLGLINIRDLFGVAAIRNAKRVELVVQLERWEPGRDYERLGIDELRYDIVGIKVPLIRMPVAPGRSLGVLVEVAARNQLLRTRGLNAARDLANRLEQQLREKEMPADADAEDDVEHGGHV
ncbi:MAG: HPr(Ser) kinase/phosphatase [Acidobacteria bacterium]|nr:MAG: HPr(Ser) kinase/phosphatase [Acidobacteriota bacterium]PYR82455.1 MAG: HPr(Ser) kinase/phosphatase [Acidobacteriota bacterium]